MPWWSTIYLLFFLWAVGAGTRDELRSGTSTPLVAVIDIISAVIWACLFVSFWSNSLRQLLGIAAPVLFVLAVGWEIYDTPRSLRTTLEDPDLTPLVRGLLVVGSIGFVLPCYIIAGIAAFN